MISHSPARHPSFHPIAHPTVRPPASWASFFVRVRSGVSNGATIARRRIACALVGHERWSSECGDWVCMRCGRLEILEVPSKPTSLGIRARSVDLPRFD